MELLDEATGNRTPKEQVSISCLLWYHHRDSPKLWRKLSRLVP